MPTPEKGKKFEQDPNFDEDKYLDEMVNEARIMLEKEQASIDSMDNQTFQLISMFALIDCMAQEEADYPNDSKSAFCQVVLKYQKQCDYLEAIDPITLYYHVEDQIDEIIPYPNAPAEKVVDLKSLGYIHIQNVRNVLSSRKTEEILAYIKDKLAPDIYEKRKKEHQFIRLLYRMRSKCVHEMTGLGESMRFNEEAKPAEPYYRDLTRCYVEDGYYHSEDVIELVIPNGFVRNILADCINGYLEECLVNKRVPFSNNHIKRKHKLSWYDK